MRKCTLENWFSILSTNKPSSYMNMPQNVFNWALKLLTCTDRSGLKEEPHQIIFSHPSWGWWKMLLEKNGIIMGDFNLDVRMELRPDNSYKTQLGHLTDFVLANHLILLVDFTTWSRTIKSIWKESFLDHVYINDIANVRNVSCMKQLAVSLVFSLTLLR